MLLNNYKVGGFGVFKTLFITPGILLVISVMMLINTLSIGGEQETPKTKKKQLLSPIRIDCLHNGNLLVSDYRQSQILTVRKDSLEVLNGFKIKGNPLGVAVSKDVVIVGNEKTKRVEVYTRGGDWLYNLGGPREYVWQPTDIAVDTNREKVFVVDGHKKVIQIFPLKGGPILSSIPANYPNSSILANPTGIAINPTREEIYVSDYGEPTSRIYARIRIFDYEGNIVSTISGRAGMMGNRFSRPQGLAIDDSDHIFFLDCYSGEIMVYDLTTNQQIKVISGFGTEPGQLNLPLDLLIDLETKDIFVTNNRSACIEVFRAGAELQ